METPAIQFTPPYVPRDSEGYVKSFTLSNCDHPEVHEAREFFDEFGFVVIANVFTPEQCADTISDIWNVIESSAGLSLRNDEKLWHSEYVLQHVFYVFSLHMRSIVLEIGGKQGLFKKALLVVQASGLDKSCLIVRCQLYMPLSLLFYRQRIC